MDNQDFDHRPSQEKKCRILKIAHIVLTVTALTLTGHILLTHIIRTPEPAPMVSQSQTGSQPDVQSEIKPELEPKPEPNPEPNPEPKQEMISKAFEMYPVGEIAVSAERDAYDSGDMILEIPRLGLISPVIAGTDEASLKKGVGLFRYAQMPGPYNSNTSLAGHRDIFGMEFYYIDTITDGDLMYLTYKSKKYTYEYMETFITGDSDWSPIKAKDFTCITLQSCDPIGTSRNRIFVVGKLINTEDGEIS